MATAINPRWLRTKRIVYKDSRTFALLLHSTAPGVWNVLNSNGVVINTTSKAIVAFYSTLYNNFRNIPDGEGVTESLERMIEKLQDGSAKTSASAFVVNAIKSDIARRERGATAGAVAAVTAAVKGRASSKFEVQPYDPDAFWYDSDDDTELYEDFITLRKNHHPINLLIAGPSGSGKTEGVGRLGKRLGIPVHIVNCQAITTPEKWLGQMMADPERGTYFEPSQHIQWVERTHEDCEGFDRCIILYDEITRLRPDLNNMTYSLFDTQKGLEVPQMGRRVIMSENNLVVATANLGAAFTGTHTQDRAFRERFSLTMERGFPPADAEIKILESSTGVSRVHAEELVKIANQSRVRWEQEELESPISTRTLKAWSLLVAGGYSVKKAAQYTVIPLYSNDGGLASDRTKIASMIEGKVA